jgi:dTDP-glucose 4,6-dehydratase
MVKVVITGGTGFVLSNVARKIRERLPDAEIVLADAADFDEMTEAFLADLGGRVRLARGDVRDRDFLRTLAEESWPTHVVHGAAVTHSEAVERTDPFRFIDVNLNGTVAVLDWLRSLPSVQRFIFVSTGAVYGRPSALTPHDIQPETGPFDPPELYAVTKYAAELVVRRYATLFSIPACRARPSDVFGPMERPTAARTGMSLPYRMAKAWREGRPLRVSGRSLLAGGDYVGAEDVAEAFLTLLFTPALHHSAYNIAAGVWRSVPELFEAFATIAPGFRFEQVPAAQAEVDLDPANRLARYNSYDVTRLAELGWRPRPLVEQLAGYLEWLQRSEIVS